MKYYIALLVFFNLTLALYGKNDNKEELKKKYDEAELYFNSSDFERALPIYLMLDSALKDNQNLKYKIGVCYLLSPNKKDKSIYYLEKASNYISKDYKNTFQQKATPIISLKYLAQAYHINYQFDESLSAYEKYKTSINPNDKNELNDVKLQMQICKYAKELYRAPVSVQTDNMGAVINSKNAEYAPVFPADESVLFFTSRRKVNNGTTSEMKENQYSEDIYVSYRSNDGWTAPLGIGPSINSSENEATVAMSFDGQQLIVCKNNDLYISKLEGNNWSSPKKLNDFINSSAEESSASISADGNAFYFISSREGGYGGKDIYKCKKLPNGEWGRPVNLGPTINSPLDEEAPYIHADGVTLFFSSKGHKNMGGYDIFFTTMLSDTGSWSEPFNMGYPVNSTDDDLYFIPTVGNRRAYYASLKKGGYGDKDIYIITFSDQRETPLTVYKGSVKYENNRIPEFITISVTDNKTNDLVGEYTPNSSTGRFLFILSPGGSYTISYMADGRELSSEKLNVPEDSSYSQTNKAIELKPVIISLKK